MRALLTTTALCILVALPAAAQDVVWRSLTEAGDPRASASPKQGLVEVGAAGPAVGNKVSNPSSRLFLPAFNVDTTDLGGTTTLFAVRNVTEVAQDATILYFDSFLNFLALDPRTLDPNQVVPINLRDIPEVVADADPDGFARGFVRIEGSGADVLTGDYFQVDPDNDFASGGRLLEIADFCQQWMIRFFNGGVFTGGTDYQVLVDIPLGSNPLTDDPTLVVDIRDGAGNLLDSVGAWFDEFVFQFNAADIVGPGVTSGSFEIFVDENAGIGAIIAGNFSARGRFTVGLDGACIPPAGL